MALAAAERVPDPPPGLRKEGKAAWEMLWTAGQSWLSPQGDWPILARLCLGYDEAALHRRKLKREGYISRGFAGQPVAHPVVGILRALEKDLTRWEGLCGFTPSDRSRLGVAEVTKLSKLDDLIARRHARANEASQGSPQTDSATL